MWNLGILALFETSSTLIPRPVRSPLATLSILLESDVGSQFRGENQANKCVPPNIHLHCLHSTAILMVIKWSMPRYLRADDTSLNLPIVEHFRIWYRVSSPVVWQMQPYCSLLMIINHIWYRTCVPQKCIDCDRPTRITLKRSKRSTVCTCYFHTAWSGHLDPISLKNKYNRNHISC